jgi:hypothetical protein
MTMPALFILAGILAVAGLRQLPMVGAQSTNILLNPSFEWDWKHQGAPELFYPDPWKMEYRDGSHPWCPSPCKRPEITQNTEYVVDGVYSVRAFAPAFSRAVFALYQEFEGEPYTEYTMTCWVRTVSDPEGGLLVSAAIQPWGASFFDSSTLRGEATRLRNEWTQVSVIAPIYGGKGKAGIWYEVEWPSQNNTLWIDACSLVRADGPVQPTPAPTYTAYPTYTPYPTPEPCPTSSPGVGCDYDTIRQVVREELDKTILTGTR